MIRLPNVFRIRFAERIILSIKPTPISEKSLPTSISPRLKFPIFHPSRGVPPPGESWTSILYPLAALVISRTTGGGHLPRSHSPRSFCVYSASTGDNQRTRPGKAIPWAEKTATEMCSWECLACCSLSCSWCCFLPDKGAHHRVDIVLDLFENAQLVREAGVRRRNEANVTTSETNTWYSRRCGDDGFSQNFSRHSTEKSKRRGACCLGYFFCNLA